MLTPLKKSLLSSRARPIAIILLILLATSLLTRIVLFVYSSQEIPFTFQNIFGIFFIGFMYDLVNAGYFLAFPLLLVWFIPQRYLNKKFGNLFMNNLFFLLTFILLFNGIAEYFFWDEFNSRFNFIAVDYLVYTTEVVGNIRQSYPIEWILAGLLLLTTSLTLLLKPAKNISHQNSPLELKPLLVVLSFPALCFLLLSNEKHQFSSNNFANELAGNGMYELFAAYRNNQLNYEQFYPHLTNEEALRFVNRNLSATGSSSQIDRYSIKHDVFNTLPERKLNVILISVESLSAEFLTQFGSSRNITPNLDSLTHHSLSFTNLYATGTRTVRGLEALSLAIPPTPGQSIVRRPNNEHLFSLATVFNEKGYESKFIYGGYGYFDNMNYFFENNGYTVVDRTSLEESEIDYENIWGVADENLFTLALREIDKTTNTHKPVFAHIMTTSNHRPYTYPEGRIDIPSHTSRAGAVKYTDYAIGKFIQEASTKEWYKNTLFVITADHCASSAGKTELPVEKYKIPLLIFSPQWAEARVENRLMSQIDIAPTLLGILHFNYMSKFFGYNLFETQPGGERAFISTYQTLGYLKKDSLVILTPKRNPAVWIVDKNNKPTSLLPEGNYQAVREAISWYQAASYEFTHDKLKGEE